MVVPVPANELYALLADYSRYKDIWPGEYKDIRVLSNKKKELGRLESSTVEFEHVPILGYSMAYALNVEGTPGRSVLWTLNSSKLIISNVGGWQLSDLGDGTTNVTYGCDVELRANVPSFVTNFILGQAFPKMLKTFARSAEREWEAIQLDRRKRFERPLQAAAASLNSTIRSLESAAESAAVSAKSLANATVQDFSLRVEESIRAVKDALLSANKAKQEVENPQLESLIAESVTQLDTAAASLLTLANSTVAELSATIDESLDALDAAAESAAQTANELARTAATQLADMQAGREPMGTGASSNASGVVAGQGVGSASARTPPQVQRLLSAGWTAVAEGTLTVLETIIPGKSPAEAPKSKRKRLGNLLGFTWKLPEERRAAAADAPAAPTSTARTTAGSEAADDDGADTLARADSGDA